MVQLRENWTFAIFPIMGNLQKLKISLMLMACMIGFSSCGSKGAVLYDQNTKSEINEYISETRNLVRFAHNWNNGTME